jgi:hypothetical protein
MDEEDFGPDLIIRPGDCVFVGICSACDAVLGTVRPDQSLDVLGALWDRHVNAPPRCQGVRA